MVVVHVVGLAVVTTKVELLGIGMVVPMTSSGS
ncbi:hypothetical protein ACVI1K_004562 [Bradyrhizobium sp. USDA 4508]